MKKSDIVCKSSYTKYLATYFFKREELKEFRKAVKLKLWQKHVVLIPYYIFWLLIGWNVIYNAFIPNIPPLLVLLAGILSYFISMYVFYFAIGLVALLIAFLNLHLIFVYVYGIVLAYTIHHAFLLLLSGRISQDGRIFILDTKKRRLLKVGR